MSLTIFQSRNLSHPRIEHAFFGREGGVSAGIYAGLNVGRGSKDDPVLVEENRRRVAAQFGVAPDRLCTLYQIHSPEVITLTGPTSGEHKADAMVTTTPNLMLGILTADCAPVLLADAAAGVIGAAHAGWKGAYSGVLEATIQAMLHLGAKRERIAAAIGPCIAQASYEVGPEFIETLVKQDPQNQQFFQANTKRRHAQFDLTGYVAKQLRASGLQQIVPLAMDTYADEARFFSYRRTTHRGEEDYGRQISAIMLRDRRAPTSSPYTGEERRVRV